MTGWGQRGPLAQRAGHDITYAALSGALHATGPAAKPVQAVNLVGDFGGGALYLLVGVLSALHERERSGRGQVVDAAMVDGATSLMTMVYGLFGQGLWRDEREANLLDGGAPFYDTYRCADGEFVAVGALEPQFFTALIAGLGLPESLAAEQADVSAWPEHRRLIAAAFASRPRDEWAVVFDGSDACVAPVLGLAEAPDHPHLRERGVFAELDGVRSRPSRPASPAHPARRRTPARPAGADTTAALRAWGVDAARIDRRPAAGVLHQAGSSDD